MSELDGIIFHGGIGSIFLAVGILAYLRGDYETAFWYALIVVGNYGMLRGGAMTANQNPIFYDEEAAIAFWTKAAFPAGMVCAYCGSDNVGRTSKCTTAKAVWCHNCEKQFNVFAGTGFDGMQIKVHRLLIYISLALHYGDDLASSFIRREVGTSWGTVEEVRRRTLAMDAALRDRLARLMGRLPVYQPCRLPVKAQMGARLGVGRDQSGATQIDNLPAFTGQRRSFNAELTRLRAIADDRERKAGLAMLLAALQVKPRLDFAGQIIDMTAAGGKPPYRGAAGEL